MENSQSGNGTTPTAMSGLDSSTQLIIIYSLAAVLFCSSAANVLLFLLLRVERSAFKLLSRRTEDSEAGESSDAAGQQNSGESTPSDEDPEYECATPQLEPGVGCSSPFRAVHAPNQGIQDPPPPGPGHEPVNREKSDSSIYAVVEDGSDGNAAAFSGPANRQEERPMKELPTAVTHHSLTGRMSNTSLIGADALAARTIHGSRHNLQAAHHVPASGDTSQFLRAGSPISAAKNVSTLPPPQRPRKPEKPQLPAKPKNLDALPKDPRRNDMSYSARPNIPNAGAYLLGPPSPSLLRKSRYSSSPRSRAGSVLRSQSVSDIYVAPGSIEDGDDEDYVAMQAQHPDLAALEALGLSDFSDLDDDAGSRASYVIMMSNVRAHHAKGKPYKDITINTTSPSSLNRDTCSDTEEDYTVMSSVLPEGLKTFSRSASEDEEDYSYAHPQEMMIATLPPPMV